MRDALGMPVKTLALRAKRSSPTILQAEQNELAGTISLNRLRDMADALECDFIYAFVPRVSIAETKAQAAKQKAKRLLSLADTQMALEDQRVTESLRKRIELLKEELINRGDIW
ncbi:MAG: hypothetical protein EOP06_05100 [Proteobacteria bacterium]|nr:MAG: hypothetical protein EOP06_05100 [Pseudomonadota bacterium]